MPATRLDTPVDGAHADDLYLGRPDVMPTGDFGIRKAFSLLYRRGRAVKPETILRHSKRWQPYRSFASWYLRRSLDP